MKIVDSSGWVEYLTRGPLFEQYREHTSDPTSLITPTIILYEVYKRVLQQAGSKSAEDAAGMLLKTQVIPLDHSTALLSAELSVKHRLAMADAIIYATARSHTATLVTSDKHFEGLPGVLFIPLPQQEAAGETAEGGKAPPDGTAEPAPL